MKRLLVASAILVLSFDASAESRYDITNMTCAKVQALVKAEGAVILSYASTRIFGLSVYDRYVSSQRYCPTGEVARGAGVPTVDKKYCQVKKCVESDLFVAR